ncbi:MAG: hypothetical protein LBO80_08365 [Treponema sp.]|nr:hypothetical protein [Treponema sp.]
MADTKQKSGKSAPGRRTAAKALNKKAAGTDAAGKTEDGGRDALAGELRSLIPRLDAEGLSFLIEQAQVHLYNMQVEELNKAVVRAESAAAKPAKRKDRFRLEGSGSRSSYYIVSVHKVGYFADRPCIFSPKGCENAFFMEVCL